MPAQVVQVEADENGLAGGECVAILRHVESPFLKRDVVEFGVHNIFPSESETQLPRYHSYYYALDALYSWRRNVRGSRVRRKYDD